MRIVFLTHSSDQGHRFRVEQYFPFLKAHRVEPAWQPLAGSLAERFSAYRQIPSYDVVCIQRRLLSPVECFWIRRKASRIVFDLDDAVMYRSSSSSRPYSFSRRFKFRYMVRMSDAVIAGNQFLKEEVLNAAPRQRVYVIPTAIDTDLYPRKKERGGGPGIVLGWIGTKGNLRYLRQLDPVFASLGRQFTGLRLKVVSDGRYDSVHLPVINKPWSLEEENEDLVSFDIGLMPLDHHPWSKGKCGLKIIQYLSVGVPVVCTPVGINRDIVTDGVNGFWAETNRQWINRLIELIHDPEMRRRMGEKGIETVQTGYSLAVTSEKFLQVLQTLVPPRRAP